MEILYSTLIAEFNELFREPNAFRSIIVLIICLLIAYWLSKYLAKSIIWLAQAVGKRSDNESDEERALQLRQIETYLSITIAIVRALVVAVTGYIAWRLLSPFAGNSAFANSAAAIGAGTFFIVVGGQTIGIILRDLTSGSMMIAEQWFNVGDYVKIEPYWDVTGVVERFTLRSTKIRSLSGEVIWVNNKDITGVHVTPRGVRTLAVDVFVRDKEEGEQAVKRLVAAIPRGKTMLAKPLKIYTSEKWGDDWRITVVGQTPPGREWLIQDYFLESVKALDSDKEKSEHLLAHPPIARFADPDADRKFRRAVRVAQEREAEEVAKKS